MPSLAQHLSGQASIAALIRWGLERVVMTPLAAIFLLQTTARIELRALVRRRRRPGSRS